MNNKLKKYISIIFSIIMLFAYHNLSYANIDEIVVEEITNKEFLNDFEKEIYKDSKIYIFSHYEVEKEETKLKLERYTTEIKDLNSISKETLKENFMENYDFENEMYKGILTLKDYNIETIENGYKERIDTKRISFEKYSSNDLNEIEKKKNINGKEYVLINVNWNVDDIEIIDNTEVPKSYKGEMIYQTVIKIKNPDTYKVSANYEGNVKTKENNSIYKLHYKLKNEKNFETPIIICFGIFIAGILFLVLKPNATIYNVQNEDLVKIKRIKVRNNKIVDITNTKINGNCFFIKVDKGVHSKLNGKKIVVKLNSQKVDVFLIKQKNYFNF